MQNSNWYIISIQGINCSRGALLVQSLLDRLQYSALVWSPSVKSKVIRYGKEVNNNKSLFSGYIFINAVIVDSKLEQALMEAKIGRFLKLPGEVLPSKISDSDIEYIKSLEESDVEPVPEEITVVEVGNLVEICVGPFMGFRGIVTGVHGHEVSIETLVFGRGTLVRINSAHLSKLTENNPGETPKE